MALQRNHRYIDMRYREPCRTGGKYSIAGAQGDPVKPPIHVLILQYVEQGQVGTVRT